MVVDRFETGIIGAERVRRIVEEALREVEKNETAYMASIDKLARLAQSKV